MNVLRKVAAIGLLLFALPNLWMAFTVPMIMATTPLLFGVGLIVLTFFIWPRDQLGV